MSPLDQPSTQPLVVARRYLSLLAAGGPREAIAELLDPDVVQTEYPNAMNPQIRVRDRAQMLTGLDDGAELLEQQIWAPPNLTVAGDGQTVLAEFDWVGITAVELGALPKGTRLSARICVILTVRDGRIVAQRNYDCYWPPAPPGEAKP